jgi:alpha-L-fucosidase
MKDIVCPGLKGRVEYAQLLHDASEVMFDETKIEHSRDGEGENPRNALTLHLPIVKPWPDVPVVELFLK